MSKAGRKEGNEGSGLMLRGKAKQYCRGHKVGQEHMPWEVGKRRQEKHITILTA